MGFLLTFNPLKSGVKLSHWLLKIWQAVYWQDVVLGYVNTNKDVKACPPKWAQSKERQDGDQEGTDVLGTHQSSEDLEVTHTTCCGARHFSPTASPKACKTEVYFSAWMCHTEVQTSLKVGTTNAVTILLL